MAQETSTDERGREHTTPVVDVVQCQWCGCDVEVRKAGRRPKFCTPAHRVAAHRGARLF